MKKKRLYKNELTSSILNKYINSKIKPYIQLDGGDIEFISYSKSTGQVKVKLLGACVGCPLSSITLKMGVEKQLQSKFPEITEVIMID